MKKFAKRAALVAIGSTMMLTAAHAGLTDRVYVHQYIYYSDASKTTMVGSANGYCGGNGNEEWLYITGQTTSHYDKVAFGYCDNGMIIYF